MNAVEDSSERVHASYQSQGYGGGIQTYLHTGNNDSKKVNEA
jgi:hypothetical protein